MADEKVTIIIAAKDEASKVLSGLHNTLSTLAKVGIAAAGAAIVGLGAVLKDSVSAAMEAEDIQAQLAAVLKSTGGAAGVTADTVNDLATALSKTTKFEDDSIVAGESMLLTFTGIGKEVFPDVTKAMLDMSQAMGQDLKTTAIQLGKALNNPAEGLTALTRVGVKFTDAQEKMIKSMVAAGDIAGAQKVILQELQNEFGGSAEAAGQTFAGKLEILKNQIGNVKEAIGGALIPVLSRLIDQYIMPLMPALEGVAVWFGNLMQNGIEMPAALQPLMDAFQNLFGALQESAPMVQDALKGMWDFVQGVIATVGPVIIANLTGIVNSLAEIWRNHGTEIMAVVSAIWNTLVVTIGGALSIITGIINAALQLLQGNWRGAWDIMSSVLVNFLNSALSLVGMNLTQFVTIWQTNFNMLATIVSTGLAMAKAALSGAVSGFVAAGKDLVGGLIAGIKAKWNEVVSWLKAQAASLPAAVRDVLGMHSPSRVFANIGANMMIGMGQGINQAAGVPAAAAVGAVSRVVNNSYSLTINEAGRRGNVVNDFNLMKSLAGA